MAVSRTTPRRRSTVRHSKCDHTGTSEREERRRPSHWPRRDDFLIGPNIFIGRISEGRRMNPSSFEHPFGLLLFLVGPVVLVGPDDLLNEGVADDVALIEVDDGDAV